MMKAMDCLIERRMNKTKMHSVYQNHRSAYLLLLLIFFALHYNMVFCQMFLGDKQVAVYKDPMWMPSLFLKAIRISWL